LGLTILLSSHLLAEVEQVCASIAVLNRGRKLFQGGIAQTRQARGWVRLRTRDFAGAVKILREAGLIERERDGEYILPAAGVGTDQLVERLVERGQRVLEIAPEEETLENFYLALMKK
jgi:ABC-2 type transport system ATP-binding protein